jgi:hypothetical protein
MWLVHMFGLANVEFTVLQKLYVDVVAVIPELRERGTLCGRNSRRFIYPPETRCSADEPLAYHSSRRRRVRNSAQTDPDIEPLYVRDGSNSEVRMLNPEVGFTFNNGNHRPSL